MKHTTSAATMAALIAAAAMAASASAHAQTKPVQGWTQQQELDPAKRVPATPQDAVDTTAEATAVAPAQAAPATQYAADPAREPAATGHEKGRGGFFLGVKGGKGWVYDDVDQSAREFNAGYRWQAGAVTLVGIEVARGRLGDTTEDGWYFPEVDYASIGVNARFNFGSGNRVYGLVRAGYMAAESDYGYGYGDLDVDGGYVGLGLGVDITRHFNVNLTYTNYVYFNEAYWSGGTFYYDADRADTLLLGAEVRF